MSLRSEPFLAQGVSIHIGDQTSGRGQSGFQAMILCLEFSVTPGILAVERRDGTSRQVDKAMRGTPQMKNGRVAVSLNFREKHSPGDEVVTLGLNNDRFCCSSYAE